jgi:hypothetical protein
VTLTVPILVKGDWECNSGLHTSLKAGLKTPGARSESDISGGGLSTRTPSKHRLLRGSYPPISIRSAISASLQAGEMFKLPKASAWTEMLESNGEERLREKTEDATDDVEIVVDCDAREGVLSVVCENSIS